MQTMAGMKWMLTLSADSWVSPIKELCQPMTAVLEMGKVQYYWKMSCARRNNQPYLSVEILCLLVPFIIAINTIAMTAGVICMGEFMTSTCTEQIPRTVYATTTNTSIASDSSVIAIVGTVGALFIMTVIVVIAMVLIAMLRLRKTKANR